MNKIRRYVFRVDATILTGAGHLKRCLTIAYELRSEGLNIIFVGNLEIPWILIELNQNRIEYCGLTDFRFSSNDILIFDKYELDQEFIKNNYFRKKIQIIDSQSPLIEADLYLHLGPDNTFFGQRSGNRINVLSGLRFLATRKFSKEIDLKNVEILTKGLLVVGGGTDIFNFGKNILEVLDSMQTYNIEIHIMSDELFFNHKKSAKNIHFHKIGGELDQIISKVDTVITTAGTSSWDFIANHLVVGIALAVDNQISNFAFQVENGFALNIGTYNSEGGWEIFVDSIKKLLFDNELRSRLIENSVNQIDLGGPKRVAAEIIKLANSLDL